MTITRIDGRTPTQLRPVRLAVDFLDRLRDTRPFAGVDELVAQLHQDVERARQIACEAQP